MTDDVLARIDAAIGSRCACGCGARLDPSGPSGWWATEACQRRWQSQAAAKPITPPATITAAARSTPAEGDRTHAPSTVDATGLSADHSSSTGDRTAGATVADWAEQLGYQLDPWQREILDRLYPVIDTSPLRPDLATGGPPAADGERVCPAGHTGPLPEVPPECYPPDAVPLPTGFITTVRPRPAPRPPWWRLISRLRHRHTPTDAPKEH